MRITGYGEDCKEGECNRKNIEDKFEGHGIGEWRELVVFLIGLFGYLNHTKLNIEFKLKNRNEERRKGGRV